MKSGKTTTVILLLTLSLLVTLIVSITFSGCKKDVATQHNTEEIAVRKKPKGPPAPFSFTNCSTPAITGNFVAGEPTSATITLNYINSPGGEYPAFTSSAVNGITLSTPAASLLRGSGSITFTASGIPFTAGTFSVPVFILESLVCNVLITVLNASPIPGNCNDPEDAVGSTGCVTFIYHGQQVTYATVRAADGRIWLQQNIGSTQVATNRFDIGSYGHYFQWGRWDDGHQLTTSLFFPGSTGTNNPSQISSGIPYFITGSSLTSNFWWFGGVNTDTWSGTIASATNGKDPCTVIGEGWRLPIAGEWANLLSVESIIDANSAFGSNLKLPEAGFRSSEDGTVFSTFSNGHYWSSTASGNSSGYNIYFDENLNAFIGQTLRGYGFPCRCIKN